MAIQDNFSPHLQFDGLQVVVIPVVLAFSVHFTLHFTPLAWLFLSDKNFTDMSPVEITFGFLILQKSLSLPLAVTVSVSPLPHLFLPLPQAKDISAHVDPILYSTVQSVFGAYFFFFCVLKLRTFPPYSMVAAFEIFPFLHTTFCAPTAAPQASTATRAATTFMLSPH